MYFSNEREFSVKSTLQYFVVVKTKRCGSSTVNVILTQQTCGQRLSMSAGSKRRALENYLHGRIRHMFLISKYRRGWTLGLWTFWILAKTGPLRHAKFRFFLVLFSQVPKKCTDVELFLLHLPGDIIFGVIIECEHSISKRFLSLVFTGHFVSDVSEVVGVTLTPNQYMFLHQNFISHLIRRYCVGEKRWVKIGGRKLVGEN